MQLSDYQAATAAAQRLMQGEVPNLIPDGKWGSFTQAAYDKVSGPLKQSVDATVKVMSRGGSVRDLAQFRDAQRRSEGPSVTSSVTDGSVAAAIRAAALEFAIPEQTLLRFAKIESNFNPRAVNGSSRGLMQMQPGAWADAQKVTSLRPYKEAVFDAAENARAGAAYIRSNRSTLDRIGYAGPWDAAHMYLAHQQGAGGLNAMWGAANGRSGKLDAANMRKNPPQDGKGVTVDPKEFYKRWVAVVEGK